MAKGGVPKTVRSPLRSVSWSSPISRAYRIEHGSSKSRAIPLFPLERRGVVKWQAATSMFLIGAF